ncbi:MAG: glycosyltransferase family 9 protein [Arcobacter sp.]|uniref:glycosyltransferase family 9 protein n=1 Tax=Arcobacter sp. TaxID=1872629 RepID=UPI003B0075A0
MKIAVIRFSALGDLASLTPILKFLKYKPTIITSPLGKAYFDDEYEDFIILKNKSILSVLKVILDIRKRKFDVIIDFQCNDRSRLISKFLNGKIYNNSNVDVYTNSTFQIFKLILKDSKLLNEIKLDFIKKEKTYIVLNCGSSKKWESKRLPMDKWIEITDYLYEKYNLPFILIGDKSEFSYIEEISNNINSKSKNLAGKTNLKELKDIIKKAFLTVSTDSAAMHISAVSKTPTIGLFGATNWMRSSPFGPWSTVVFDKTYFKDSNPLTSNMLDIKEEVYKNISIKEGLSKIEEYL